MTCQRNRCKLTTMVSYPFPSSEIQSTYIHPLGQFMLASPLGYLCSYPLTSSILSLYISSRNCNQVPIYSIPHHPTTPLHLQHQDQSNGNGGKEKRKRHVVVFPEEEVSPELLQRRKHHVVTINSLDGSYKLVSNPTVDQVSMQINEEMEPAEVESPGALRRYVVIVLNDGETGLDVTGGEE